MLPPWDRCFVPWHRLQGTFESKFKMEEQKQLLIIGSGTGAHSVLGPALANDGLFEVTEAANAAEAMTRTHTRQQRFHAILVETVPGSADGSDICGWLRHRGLRLPINVLSEAVAEADVVRAFDAGANDYLMKPYRLAELQARLRARIRDHE